MRRICSAVSVAVSLLLQTFVRGVTCYNASWASLVQKPVPEWFRDAKFGIYGHWGVYSVPAYAVRPEPYCRIAGSDCPERCPANTTAICGPCQGVDRCSCPQGYTASAAYYPHSMYLQGSPVSKHHQQTYGSHFGYKDFIPQFTAPKFDAKTWAKLYVRAGAQYAGPVSEHCDGFAMWNTSFSTFNAASMGPRRDIVGEVAEAVKELGLRTVATFHHHWLWGWYHTGVHHHTKRKTKYLTRCVLLWAGQVSNTTYQRSVNDTGDPQYQLTSMEGGHGGLYGERTCCTGHSCQEVFANGSCAQCHEVACTSLSRYFLYQSLLRMPPHTGAMCEFALHELHHEQGSGTRQENGAGPGVL